MKPLTLIFSLLCFSLVVSAQNASTNGLGSTPSQRYVINQLQAYMVIQGAAAQAANLSVSENIAVVGKSSALPFL